MYYVFSWTLWKNSCFCSCSTAHEIHPWPVFLKHTEVTNLSQCWLPSLFTNSGGVGKKGRELGAQQKNKISPTHTQILFSVNLDIEPRGGVLSPPTGFQPWRAAPPGDRNPKSPFCAGSFKNKTLPVILMILCSYVVRSNFARWC